MVLSYHMPTKIHMGRDVIFKQRDQMQGLGEKAMIVTGKTSARISGALKDVEAALSACEIDYCIFDQVSSNPSVACVMAGVAYGIKEHVDFVVAIGGGSPIDAAKAMALGIANQLGNQQLMDKSRYHTCLPIVAVPTTAGTGSEVTQYAIITDPSKETKVGIADYRLFPRVTYLDAHYTKGLSAEQTLYTAIDALSHGVEGLLSVKASPLSDAMAVEAVGQIWQGLESWCTEGFGPISESLRETFLYAASLCGMVIAQTGTTVVHAMGYGLTYYEGIDHGKANGLLLAPYLSYVSKKNEKLFEKVLQALQVDGLNTFDQKLKEWLGSVMMSKNNLEKMVGQVLLTPNMNNGVVRPDIRAVRQMLRSGIELV